MKYQRKYSNFGAKIQICQKVKFCQNRIFKIFLTPRILDEDSEQDVGGGCSEAAEQHGLLPVEFLDR